jgi:molybdopterin synthase catalytic subunit
VHVQVLFFAQAREFAGRDKVLLELPDGSRVRDALAAIAREHPALEPLRAHLAVAVNGTLARADEVIPDTAELALLPPVSGG